MHDQTDLPPAMAQDTGPRKLSRNEKVMAAMLLAAIVALGVASSLRAISSNQEVESIRPEMEALADRGEPEAVLWVAEHSIEPDVSLGEKLKAAAETGHPESMYRFALFLGYRNLPDDKYTWMQKAADTGYPQAVLIMHNRKIGIENE